MSDLTKLSKEVRQRLNEALQSAFPSGASLDQMIRIQLDQNPGTVSGGTTLAERVYHLIEWAESRGQLVELLKASLAENPGNPDLQALSSVLIPAVAVAGIPTTEVRPLSKIERADRYVELVDAFEGEEYRRVLELAKGIEDFRDVTHYVAEAKAKVESQPTLISMIADAYADRDWPRVIYLAYQLGPEIPADVLRWLDRAWKEIPTTDLVIEAHHEPAACLVLTPDGRTAISGSEDKTIKLWTLPTGQLARVYTGHIAGVKALVLTPDNQGIISGSYDNTIRIWNVSTGEILRVLKGHTRPVLALALAPDGRRILSGSEDATMRLWDLMTGRTIRIFKGHSRYVRSVAFTPDGRYIVSGSADRTVGFWDLATGQLIRTLEGHTDEVHRVKVIPDGRRVISSAADNTLKLWDLATGQLLRTFEGHTDYVNAMEIMPNGRHVLSASADKTLRLWDIDTGHVLWIFYGHKTSIRSVAVAEDGRSFISGAKDGTIRVWVNRSYV